MAVADNIRTQYQDGLVLGASQLTGDQTYVRASLERRSLSRDLFGIAWGLELTLETASPDAATSAVVRVEPGVAYGGDGKTLVLRERGEVSSLLVGKPPSSSWAVYLVFTETAQSGQSGFSFCGQAMDPKVLEGADFAIERFGNPLSPGERDGARVEPQAQLGAGSTPVLDRVCLGVVDINSDGLPSLRRTRGTVEIPEPETTPTQSELAQIKGPLEQAQYIGSIASALSHPRAWTASKGGTLTPAVELGPVSGIHLREKTELHDDAHAAGILMVEGTIVAQGGISTVLKVDSSVSAADLTNLAVAWRNDGVDKAATSGSSADGERVLGIVIGAHDAAAKYVRVVCSGLAVAKLGTTSNRNPGDWLVLDDQGKLKQTTSPAAGSLVAKFIAAVDGTRAQVLVTLG